MGEKPPLCIYYNNICVLPLTFLSLYLHTLTHEHRCHAYASRSTRLFFASLTMHKPTRQDV